MGGSNPIPYDSKSRTAALAIHLAFAVLVLVLQSGCGRTMPPAALEVGDASYTDEELGALGGRERDQLALLTAFGLVVSAGELDRLAEPFIARDARTRLLSKLTLEVAALEEGYDRDRIEQAYSAAPEYELVVRHLVILSERWRPTEQRDAARNRAAEALSKIEGGASFSEIAGEYSEEEGAERRGGLLKPGRRGTWVGEFWDAALALEPGDVSEVVETTYGFHVLQLEDKRPVPLDEVREEFLARLVDPSTAASAAEGWATRQTERLSLEEGNVLAWREGALADTATLATWPGGSYRGSDLNSYLSTLDQANVERVAAAGSDAYLQVVRSLAGNALLAQEAERLGITLNAEERAEIESAVLTRFHGLAAALGFRRGAEKSTIKATALQALSPRDQRARIARGELLEAAPALRKLYPIRITTPEPPTH